MIHTHITGTSKGIGRSLAEALLEKGYNVYGYSRTNSISHKNYQHIPIDLSDLRETKKIKFRLSEVNSGDRIVLVNNAGMIEPVKYIGEFDNDLLINHYNVNLISPVILINNFLRIFGNNEVDPIVINVSSGAGKYPVDGWAAYCSAKSALDMETDVANKENNLRQGKCRFFAIAPGIVDTPMQEDIRKVNKENFSRIAEFIDYKESDKLADSDHVARKFVDIIEHPDRYAKVKFRF